MVVERQYIRADQFLEVVAAPQYDDCIVELVNGELVEMPKPGGEHGEIAMRVGAMLFNHVSAHDLGRVTAAETGFVLERNPDGRDTVRGLDVAFISKAKASKPLSHSLVSIPPDLAVEVVSPSNEAKDIRKKIRQLLNAGTSLIWIVYPDMRIVDAHTSAGATTFEEDDSLTGGDVLPGFEVRVADIFPS